MVRLFTLLFLLISFQGFSQDKVNRISGVVSDMGYPLANVNISIKGTTEGIQTDKNGKYEINARPRDVLVFSYVGMHDVLIIVEDVTRILNIAMTPRVEELDEVVVEQRKKKGQEGLQLDYATNKSIVRTTFGFIDAENAGYSMFTVDGDNLNPGAVDILTALQGKIPGLTIETINSQGGGIERVAFIRGRSSALNPMPAIFEVDGQIFTSVPNFLDIARIDRIATLPGLGATAKYGSQGAGGVIIINTKGSFVMREEGTNKPYDQAKLRNNKFNEKTALRKLKTVVPKYILEIEKATTVEEALIVYESQKKLYGGSPYFFLDVSKKIKDKFGNQEKADFVLEEMKARYAKNAEALKALAYVLESEKRHADALTIYKEVFKLRPRYAQSYRDLANMYALNGEYKKALGLHARYHQLRKMDSIALTFDGIDAILDLESSNLIARKGEELKIEKGDVSESDIGGTRVLFEWNNTEAEFDLQFVNPDKHYFVWSHTLENEAERIYDEKIKGYSCEHFLIDKSLLGQWKINIKYFGNKAYNPTYMKATVYYD
ncbi:MAG: carboxypeptidase-like regulatory domain-containing protein, partial [Maribacter sp.]|nr:carboxypeptidase-like regulatory domain-containing protein [Maribacter sp.]